MRVEDINVLVACEFSGTVRDAFSELGCNAWSCDLLDTESEQTIKEGKHYKGDVLDIIRQESRIRTKIGMPKRFDIMIAHPPCQYLAYSGISSWNDKGRVYKRLEALKFFVNPILLS